MQLRYSRGGGDIRRRDGAHVVLADETDSQQHVAVGGVDIGGGIL